jgi:prephenate dehydratase
MKDNVTRFVVLSRDPLVASDALTSGVPYKTSIVFSLQEVGAGGWVAARVQRCGGGKPWEK